LLFGTTTFFGAAAAAFLTILTVALICKEARRDFGEFEESTVGIGCPGEPTNSCPCCDMWRDAGDASAGEECPERACAEDRCGATNIAEFGMARSIDEV
jgi:hypothetical protein